MRTFVFSLLAFSGLVLASGALANEVYGDPFADDDGDGLQNFEDFCNASVAQSAVDQDGTWTGCSEGEQFSAADFDRDGVIDTYDLCSNSPYGATVHLNATWLGCAPGEYRDADVAYAPSCGVRPRLFGCGHRLFHHGHHARWRCHGLFGRRIIGCRR
jgi:hypothetical protein